MAWNRELQPKQIDNEQHILIEFNEQEIDNLAGFFQALHDFDEKKPTDTLLIVNDFYELFRFAGICIEQFKKTHELS